MVKVVVVVVACCVRCAFLCVVCVCARVRVCVCVCVCVSVWVANYPICMVMVVCIVYMLYGWLVGVKLSLIYSQFCCNQTRRTEGSTMV